MSLKPSRILELGDAYASTTVNTTIFRHHGVATHGDWQFTAYYTSNNSFRVVRRNLYNDEMQCTTIKGQFNTVDVHNCISLGVDSDGYVHISYDHHGVELNYRRSLAPHDITAWSNPLPMTGINEERVTYPYFLMQPATATSPERLLFLYRHGGSGNGDSCLKIYDPSTQSWADLSQRFVKGTEQMPWTSNAYWNHPAFDIYGNLLLSWVWRVNQKASAGADFIFNHNHGFAKSPDGVRWFTAHGVELSLPMTQINSEIVWPTPPGATIANQCSSAVDSEGHLHIAWHGALHPGGPPQYQHLWFDGDRWQCNVVSDRITTFGLLAWDVPMSRPEIVIDFSDTVYVLYRCDLTGQKLVAQRLSPPNYTPVNDIIELWPDELGHSEPIIDRVRWQRDGILTAYVQRATQPELHAKEELPSESAFLVDWQFT